METLEVIKNRRSIRSYIKKDLPPKIIEDILNCGRLAPSSKNKQPWYFVVTRNEIKDKIADIMIDYITNTNEISELKRLGYRSSVNNTANIIKQAPVLILIFKEKNDNWIIRR